MIIKYKLSPTLTHYYCMVDYTSMRHIDQINYVTFQQVVLHHPSQNQSTIALKSDKNNPRFKTINIPTEIFFSDIL